MRRRRPAAIERGRMLSVVPPGGHDLTVQAASRGPWMWGAGDDCLRAAPCLTFNGALLPTDPDWALVVLDARDFGAVTITTTVAIDGTPQDAGLSTAGTTGAIDCRGERQSGTAGVVRPRQR